MVIEGGINTSAVSKPFVIAAVASVFAGSLIGSAWMMAFHGARLPIDSAVYSLHKVLQVDGFLTLMIMGIGYMIVPRFRNVDLPSTMLAYASLVMVLIAVAASIVSVTTSNGAMKAVADVLRLAGTSIFAAMVLWMLRVRPKLLRLADYFMTLSVVVLIVVNTLQAAGLGSGSLGGIQMWLLFPILMIFGVKYKTMPSFLGFMRPRKGLAQTSLALAAAAVALGSASVVQDSALLSLAFNAALFSSAILFAMSLFIFGGFDNSEILRLISGEKKARYLYTTNYVKLAFALLYAGLAFAILFGALGGDRTFLFYDLAIHYTAIGFIGTTVALYLPLMLPPILGRQVHFSKFNHAPIILLVAALAMRGAGDLFIGAPTGPASYVLMTSGWLVVAALFIFVAMLHRSMKAQGATQTAYD